MSLLYDVYDMYDVRKEYAEGRHHAAAALLEVVHHIKYVDSCCVKLSPGETRYEERDSSPSI